MTNTTEDREITVVFPENKRVASITLSIAERDTHGAPCYIIVAPTPDADWQFASKVADVRAALNSTPDGLHWTDGEMSTDAAHLLTHTLKNDIGFRERDMMKPNHGSSAGGGSIYIDHINAQHMPTVAAKALRAMGRTGLLSQTEVEQAFAAFKEQKFELPVRSLPEFDSEAQEVVANLKKGYGIN